VCSWRRFIKEGNKRQTTSINYRDVIQNDVCLRPAKKYEKVATSCLGNIEISCVTPGRVTSCGYFSPDNIQTRLLVHHPPFQPEDGRIALLRNVGTYNPIRKRRRIPEDRNFQWVPGCSKSFVVALRLIHWTVIFRRSKA
jgi:hypothetical protein